MTYLAFRQKIQQELAAIYDAQEADNILYMVLEEATGFSRSKLRTLDREEMPEVFTFRIYKYMHGLLQHQPVQYALGYAWFYKHKFTVNPSVLIPRKETEELVYRIVKEYRGRKVSLLDIGTGSGCIAISLQLELPETEVSAMDVSPEALQTAKANAATLNAEKVRFIEADILDKAQGPELGTYDVIVSNPPYITEAEKAGMHNNVLLHEPHAALFVRNGDPLQFYKAIAVFAQSHLHAGGQLFFECNESYAQQVAAWLKQNNFASAEVIKDMQGKDRIVQAQRN